MRELPVRAQLYLIICYLCGFLALGWMIISSRDTIGLGDWLLGGLLAISASMAQVLVVTRVGTAGQRSDHLTLAPLFAGVVLLPSPVLALLTIWTFLPEWYLRRRSWFAQVFNIAAYLIAGALAHEGARLLSESNLLSEWALLAPLGSLTALIMLPIYEATQIILLAWVLKLARGQSFRTSGLFSAESLLLEISLLGVGLAFAISWRVTPIYGLLAALPLVLIYQALHVSNLREQATTDPKTGLANMRHFDDVFARELDRGMRQDSPVSLLVADLDYLRNINNTYGHQAGDIVLIGLADVIKRNIRSTDVAARFGGEEFVILLPDTPSDLAVEIAESINRELAEMRFDVGNQGGPISASVSIGVATAPRDGHSTEVLMREADLAVYQAKREGRNRVSVAGSSSRALAGEWAREHLIPATVTDSYSPGSGRRLFWEEINRLTRASFNAEEARNQATSKAVRKSSEKGKSGARPHNARRKDDPDALILIIIMAVLLGGLLSVLPGFRLETAPWSALLLFAVLTVIAEQLAVDNAGNGKVSVSVVTILTAGFLFQELGVLVTAIAAIISMALRGQTRVHRVLFNLGTVLLAGSAARWTFQLTSGDALQALAVVRGIVPAIAAGLAYHVVNQVLICLIRGLSERRAPFEIWYQEYRWLWPHYAVLGALALVVALGYEALVQSA